MRHRIFLPLLLVLSATAFSASAMAASDSPPPPVFSHRFWCCRLQPFRHRRWLPVIPPHHQIIQNTPPVAGHQTLKH
ncbi:PagK family vesicle-borne virulence factor [Salmonella enterica]|uniref:PagK family vesicle-borne virulence factor n=1 Tax=Salmonella enterica TaxID=28901 RepID=UPI0003EB268C|nr:PagK family vesicle-borne virulence factor [Salmonella enterica]